MNSIAMIIAAITQCSTRAGKPNVVEAFITVLPTQSRHTRYPGLFTCPAQIRIRIGRRPRRQQRIPDA